MMVFEHRPVGRIFSKTNMPFVFSLNGSIAFLSLYIQLSKVYLPRATS